MSQLPWLDHTYTFPPPSSALSEPDGLLAAGGDLSSKRIISAYQKGIFPWYSDGQPILWWSPNPRCVIFPNQMYQSRSLRKHIRKTNPTLTFDQHFEDVIHYCSRSNTDEDTWITEEMEAAYIALFHQGIAHSVEVWEEGELTGGLYGLSLGRCFFGESMFSLRPNSSKIAFSALCQQLQKWNYALIDCQVENPHLISLGASTIDREHFLSILETNIDQPPRQNSWQFDFKNT